MRSLVVPLPLLFLILLLTIHIARADEKSSGKDHNLDSPQELKREDDKKNINNGVGPVKNPHCKKSGNGPNKDDQKGKPKKNGEECDDGEGSPSPLDAAQPPSYVSLSSSPPYSVVPTTLPTQSSPSSQYTTAPTTLPTNQSPPPVATPLATPPPQSPPSQYSPSATPPTNQSPSTAPNPPTIALP
jgi:hypothetical protein